MRVLSGIKPTGKLTLGNYIGALKTSPNIKVTMKFSYSLPTYTP